jgi:hypothetical protein
MTRLHIGHQGAEKCFRRAKEGIWWPGMRADLVKMVGQCEACIKEGVMKHEPLLETPRPEGPWEVVGSDLFEFRGVHYVLLVDYFSRWIEVVEIPDQTAQSVVMKVKRVFARLGVPVEMRSDNGRCYDSARFKRFAEEEMKFRHVTSSPRYPESNGMAERAVRTVKEMWQKEGDKNGALMAYRSSPLESGVSPFELLHGRRMRTNVYRGDHKLDLEGFRRKDREVRAGQKKCTDRRRRAQKLTPLKKGDRVWVKESRESKGVEGEVRERAVEPFSYWVRVRGRNLRRTRKHLRKLGPKGVDSSRSQSSEGEGAGSEREDGSELGMRQESEDSSEDPSEGEEEESTGEESDEGEPEEPAEEERGNEGRGEGEGSPRPVKTRSGRSVRRGHLGKDYDWN